MYNDTFNDLGIVIENCTFILLLTFSPECNVSVVTEAPGVIRSPGYPSGYPIGDFCGYQFNANGYYGIELRFIDFDVKNGNANQCETSGDLFGAWVRVSERFDPMEV